MRKTLTLCAAMAVGSTLLAPRPAAACGGFFCNRQPVNQAAERIVFSYESDGTITVAVQIAYSGEAESFAWILPAPNEPTAVGVGTDALFTRLDSATTPRFQLDYETAGTCRPSPSCPSDWGRLEEDGPFAGGGFADAAAAPTDPSVEVRLRAAVGPFDVAVLRSGDADALRTWLTDNGYDLPVEATAELDHYVALDHFFVALRLLKDREAGEIQPIVLRFPNDEPCIPIRLTRIATVPDMPIIAYFLGERRVRPSNYMLLEPDLEERGLYDGSIRYVDHISRQVDDMGGHAFVTEYAGSVPAIELALRDIEDLRAETDPGRFLMGLQERGFDGDAQLLALLTRFIPPPPETEEFPQQFYNCIVRSWGCPEYEAYVAALPFNPGAFVDALTTAIVAPRREAETMLERASYLTRLFTTLSAEEMTLDPMFTTETVLGDVSNVHEATVRTECSRQYFDWTAPQTLIFASGRSVPYREGVVYEGSDADYCEDLSEGTFAPGVPLTTLQATAARRARWPRPTGGGVCAASPAASGAGAVVLVAAALALVMARRR